MSGIGGLIDIERKGCELIIHDHDLWVAILGWVDVPDSDQGDFRRRLAIDISSCHCYYYLHHYHYHAGGHSMVGSTGHNYTCTTFKCRPTER